jgi:hypothetical protein
VIFAVRCAAVLSAWRGGGGGAGPTFADFDVGVYWRPQVGGQILIGSIEPECKTEQNRAPPCFAIGDFIIVLSNASLNIIKIKPGQGRAGMGQQLIDWRFD